jgi:hypothetical protein
VEGLYFFIGFDADVRESSDSLIKVRCTGALGFVGGNLGRRYGAFGERMQYRGGELGFARMSFARFC